MFLFLKNKRKKQTLIQSSSDSVGQMWCGSVMVVLSGLRMTLVLSGLMCMPRMIRMTRENAVYEEIVWNKDKHWRNCKKDNEGKVDFKIKNKPSANRRTD